MSRATFLIFRYVMCELAVSTLPSGFPVKVRAWFSHISTGFKKIEWSANNDHEWNAKNDHRWVIFIPSKTISAAPERRPWSTARTSARDANFMRRPCADASALSKLNSWRLLKLIKIKSARSRLYRSQILQVNTCWN